MIAIVLPHCSGLHRNVVTYDLLLRSSSQLVVEAKSSEGLSELSVQMASPSAWQVGADY